MNSNNLNSEMEVHLTPPDVVALAQHTAENLLPTKSKEKYTLTYNNFNLWRKERNVTSYSENVLLAYFSEISKSLKPSTLWARYSMLKSTLNLNNNIDISKYIKLTSYLKRQSDGFHSKKSKVLSSEEIEKFINEAPNDKYLDTKVNI